MLRDLKVLGIEAIAGFKGSPWKRERALHVLIQTLEGFDEALWYSALSEVCRPGNQDVEILLVRRKTDFYTALMQADICTTIDISDTLFKVGSRLKWVNALVAGIDLEGSIPASVSVTTSRGIAARSMAEHALALIFILSRGLLQSGDVFETWEATQRRLLKKERDLAGKTVVVVGLGSVGQELARLCRAIGMRIVAVRRRALMEGNLYDEVYSLDDIQCALPHADFLVLAIPLTQRTFHLVGKTELGLMKPQSYIINIARGELIDEVELAQALRSAKIAGAGLDVLTEEPPGKNSPLRGCPSLVITPHVSGNIHRFREEIAHRFAQNLSAYLCGEPLEGLVATGDGTGAGKPGVCR
ncbi:MAG: hypothetical protein FJY85_01545 [Deltaproteobacteria bacterium]|nr:hypothetical protein [Deltaproteobacteria bacterium]